MSKPIITKNTVAKSYHTVETEHSYEYLLDLFDDGSIVRPLVLRCQEYEQLLLEANYLISQSIGPNSEWITRRNRWLKTIEDTDI